MRRVKVSRPAGSSTAFAAGLAGMRTSPVVIVLGVDTLCWHLLLERRELTVEQVFEQAAQLGCASVQLNLHHVRERPAAEIPRLRERAGGLGLRLLASGDFLGQARNGDEPAVGVGRVERWLEQSVALGSPVLRVASGFYRADLMAAPELIERERRYVITVLELSLSRATGAGVRLLLENHSDFTVAEYRSIVLELGREKVGVFLDLINPIAALEDPLPVVEELAHFAAAGHVKDYLFRSIQTDDAYHRRGFQVLYRYPGEGVAPLAALIAALRRGVADRDFSLSIEGLDNHAGVHDQVERLRPSLALLRTLLGEAA
jgi:sugar phosphate isomerase/epimerase